MRFILVNSLKLPYSPEYAKDRAVVAVGWDGLEYLKTETGFQILFECWAWVVAVY